MSLILIEGFDYYPDNVNEPGYGLNSTWIGAGGYFQAGRFAPGKSMRFGGDGNGSTGPLQLPFTPAKQHVIGFAFIEYASFSSLNGYTVQKWGSDHTTWLDDEGNPHISMRIDGVGNFNFVLVQGDVLILQCPRRCVRNNWHYIEVAINCDPVAGSLHVSIDGEDQGTYNGKTQATNRPNIARIRYQRYLANTTDFAVDDMYIKTDELELLGECRIQLLEPNADAAVAFARSGGASNFVNVGANSSDGDTSYNSSNDVGARDFFANTGISVNPDKIHAIGLNIAARKEDSGTRTIRGVMKSAGQTGVSTNYNLTVNYTWTRKIFLFDPATTLAWTKGAANAMQLGYEVVQ